MSENITFPGDKIGSIEEYEAGNNTFDDGDMVRSAVIGTTQVDKKNRIVEVKNPKILPIPKKDDLVIGTVAAVMSSMIAVTIEYINGKQVMSHVECICSTRNLRKKTIALLNDIVMLRIISNLNGTNHAFIDEPGLGVLFTRCVKCGGDVMRLGDSIKCKSCSWIDDRKLSRNFGNSDFVKISDHK